MYGIIYKITNKITSKSYIGQTIQPLSKRWWRHKNEALKKNSSLAFHLAIKKYGPDNFSLEILRICHSLKEMNFMETEYIQRLNTLSPNGYNLDGGGNNRIPTQETRNKISGANKGKPSHNKGQKQSKETVKKRSDSLKGRKLSQSHRQKLSSSHMRKIICHENGIVYSSTKEAASQLNVFASNIFKVLNGEYKQAGGYTFSYFQD